jgi:ureidoacrylate peracid hydrolase
MTSDSLLKRSELLDPRRTAVLVVDMQKLFTLARPEPMFPPVEGVLERLSRFIDQAVESGALIIRVQTLQPLETYSAVWRQQLGWGDRSPLDPADAGSAFHPGFEPRPGELVVTKHRYSAFFGTTLDSILRAQAVSTVIVAGLTTDVCVGSTARDAFQHEYSVITLSDCTAEVTRARHELGLQTLAANFGMVCTADEVVQLWSSASTRTEVSVV